MQLDAGKENTKFLLEKDFSEIYSRINNLMKLRDFVLVAIDGSCGSGKSTLAQALRENYDCNVFHTDDYFLRPELRIPERLREIGGNIDYVRFKEEVISGLLTGKEFLYRRFNCTRMSLEKPITAVPKKLNVIEGVYSMHPTLINYYDLKIFMEISQSEQKQRILERNGEIMQRRYLKEWIPLEDRYFKEMKIKEKCDLILHG